MFHVIIITIVKLLQYVQCPCDLSSQVHKNNVAFEIQHDFGLNYHRKDAHSIPKTTTIKRAFVPNPRVCINQCRKQEEREKVVCDV
jgi:hypothetical protein